MNTKLHAVTDANGRPISFFMSSIGARRVATRYDRCPKAFFSAVALAATVIFWL